MRLFESWRTTASSTGRSSAEAVDMAAATARGTSDACIFALPSPKGQLEDVAPTVVTVSEPVAVRLG